MKKKTKKTTHEIVGDPSQLYLISQLQCNTMKGVIFLEKKKKKKHHLISTTGNFFKIEELMTVSSPQFSLTDEQNDFNIN